MSGLLCGILFGRALAGAVAVHYGWRATFWLGLLMAIAIGVVLAIALPKSPSKTQASYGELLKSLVTLWREEPQLRYATMTQACVFGSFSVLWTTLALHLQARYHLGADVAGLFGIIGAVGVLFAPIAGKLADRRGPHFVIGLASVAMIVSWAVFGVWGMVAGLIAGVVLLDFGAQGTSLEPARHSDASPGSSQSPERHADEWHVLGRCNWLCRSKPCLGVRWLDCGLCPWSRFRSRCVRSVCQRSQIVEPQVVRYRRSTTCLSGVGLPGFIERTRSCSDGRPIRRFRS